MSKWNSLIALLLVSAGASADMPYIMNNVAESRDRIQNGDLTCESSRPQATINAGVYGNNGSEYRYEDRDKGAYVGISIPMGTGTKVDCNRLYDLTVQQKELQIKQLQQQLADLKQNSQLQSDRAMSAN